jgi:hypothetical protein
MTAIASIRGETHAIAVSATNDQMLPTGPRPAG